MIMSDGAVCQGILKVTMEYGVGRSKCKVRLYSLASYERGATGDDGAKVKVSPITVGMGTLCEAQNVEGGREKTSKTERRETRETTSGG